MISLENSLQAQSQEAQVSGIQVSQKVSFKVFPVESSHLQQLDSAF